MAGIDETKDVLDFILSLASSIGKSMEDGKFGYHDLGCLFSSLRKAPAAIVGVSEVAGEISDLDKTEKEELIRFFINKFDIPNDQFEVVFEEGFAAAISIIHLVNRFR